MAVFNDFVVNYMTQSLNGLELGDEQALKGVYTELRARLINRPHV